eukprot:Lithocolla_globosa_v1_NODE_697_length_3419_cov_8.246136.p1 type:complete len:882 gc:universal NODE_697_length_3419_cov_8.246136:2685-40(-)
MEESEDLEVPTLLLTPLGNSVSGLSLASENSTSSLSKPEEVVVDEKKSTNKAKRESKVGNLLEVEPNRASTLRWRRTSNATKAKISTKASSAHLAIKALENGEIKLDLTRAVTTELKLSSVFSQFSSMEETKKVESLKLSSNNLSATGSSTLSKFLPQFILLKSLNLDLNSLTDTSIRSLSGSLPSSITTLSLQYNLLDFGAGETFAQEILPHLPNLQFLNLGFNSLGDVGVTALSTQLVQHCPKLRALALDENGITDTGAQVLIENLRSLENVKELFLTNNPLNDITVEWLASWMTTQEPGGSRLLTVDVSSCEYKAHATVILYEAFIQNKELSINGFSHSKLKTDSEISKAFLNTLTPSQVKYGNTFDVPELGKKLQSLVYLLNEEDFTHYVRDADVDVLNCSLMGGILDPTGNRGSELIVSLEVFHGHGLRVLSAITSAERQDMINHPVVQAWMDAAWLDPRYYALKWYQKILWLFCFETAFLIGKIPFIYRYLFGVYKQSHTGKYSEAVYPDTYPVGWGLRYYIGDFLFSVGLITSFMVILFVTEDPHSYNQETHLFTRIVFESCFIFLFLCALFMEMREFWVGGRKHLQNFFNFMDFIFLCCSGLVILLRIFSIFVNPDSETNFFWLEIERVAIATVGLILWIKSLHLTTPFRAIGPFIKIMGKMLQAVLRWLLVSVFIFLSFSTAFYALYNYAEAIDPVAMPYSGVYNSFDETIFVMFEAIAGKKSISQDVASGNEDLRRISYIASIVLFFLFTFVGTLLMYSLLIASVTWSYKIVAEQQESAWGVQQLRFLLDTRDFLAKNPPTHLSVSRSKVNRLLDQRGFGKKADNRLSEVKVLEFKLNEVLRRLDDFLDFREMMGAGQSVPEEFLTSSSTE